MRATRSLDGPCPVPPGRFPCASRYVSHLLSFTRADADTEHKLPPKPIRLSSTHSVCSHHLIREKGDLPGTQGKETPKPTRSCKQCNAALGARPCILSNPPSLLRQLQPRLSFVHPDFILSARRPTARKIFQIKLHFLLFSSPEHGMSKRRANFTPRKSTL